MQGRQTVLLLDTDTLTKWVFGSGSKPPIISESELDPTWRIASPFFAEPELRGHARFGSEELARQGLDPAEFERESSLVLDRYFQLLYTPEVNSAMCQRWIAYAKEAPLHPNTTWESLWLIVTAIALKQLGRVILASEQPEIYVAYQQAGYLNDVVILRDGWQTDDTL